MRALLFTHMKSMKPTCISRSMRYFSTTKLSQRPKITSYEDFDYSNFFYQTDENEKLEGNKCSTLSWLTKSMEDYVVNNILGIPETERANKRVLDIACGPGNYVYRMNNLGFTDVTGIDICNRSLKIAQKLCKDLPKDNVQFNLLDAKELLNATEYHKQFDIINVQWLYCHAPSRNDIKTYSNAIAKCIKDDGILTGMDWNANQRGSLQEEWLQFGVFLFNDKYANYNPVDGEFIRSRFACKGGGRILPALKPDENVDNLPNEIDDVRVDYGQQIDVYWWKQDTIKKGLQDAGFVVKFDEPSLWNIDNQDSCTLNDNEKLVFREYIHMGNVQ
eukprot:770798_1